MAFEFVRSENSTSPIEKEIVATSGTSYAHGVLLKYGEAGTAVLATTGPEYVYVGKTTTAAAGDKLAVVPILPEYEFATEFSADASALKVGAKVTVASTADKATATTSNGIFEILTAGGASGTKVVGKFA